MFYLKHSSTSMEKEFKKIFMQFRQIIFTHNVVKYQCSIIWLKKIVRKELEMHYINRYIRKMQAMQKRESFQVFQRTD